MTQVHWIYLAIASLCEVGWTLGLKQSAGFSRLGPSLWTIALMALSLLFLGLAVRGLPLGTSYAVWTGIGTIGAVIGGIVWFAEPLTAQRMVCVVLILIGIVGLKMAPAGG
jgi:quaternary ammonium compound-resistance protein SugE